MRDPSIARKARFTDIRYAQVWEDADILLDALAIKLTRYLRVLPPAVQDKLVAFIASLARG